MPDPTHGGVHAARALAATGVSTVFALPGGHVLPLFDAVRAEGLRLIDTRHEENAVLMAAGWALATGEAGVAAVTAGPGLTNALPGIAEAHASGIPVVVIAGRTAMAQRHRGAVQDVRQLEIVAPVTKWRAECLGADQIPRLVTEAVHQARSGAPGVAYLEIPQDVFAAPTPPAAPPHPAGHPSEARSVPPPEEVAQAVALLTAAERPVVLAGSGAFFSGAGAALTEFIERSGIPLVTTSAARGIVDDDHPHCAGSLVHGGVALASADVSLLLGSRFNANLIYGGLPLFAPDQRVIQVDVRPEHLGGLRRPELALAGDVAATVRALIAAWQGDGGRWETWRTDVADAARSSRDSWAAEADGPANGIHPGWLARTVAEFADEHRPGTFVTDGGDSVVWGLAFATAHRPGSHMFIGSAMGTLGVGLPFAIGAKAARPEEPVVLLTGDGAFGMSAMELDTAARYGLPVLVVVVNNGGWGDVRHEARHAFGEDTPLLPMSPMRYELLAKAVGGYGERVDEPAAVRPALERAMAAVRDGAPALVDAVCDPEVISDFMANLAGLELM